MPRKIKVQRKAIRIWSPASGRQVSGFRYTFIVDGKVVGQAEDSYAHDYSALQSRNGGHTYPRIIRDSATGNYLGSNISEAKSNVLRIVRETERSL